MDSLSHFFERTSKVGFKTFKKKKMVIFFLVINLKSLVTSKFCFAFCTAYRKGFLGSNCPKKNFIRPLSYKLVRLGLNFSGLRNLINGHFNQV